jgi:hypothetical protein
VKSNFSSKRADSTMAARLSVPYCVSVALVDDKQVDEILSYLRTLK